MPITVHCPHDKAELELVPDKKSPDGLLECPKCHCTFRVCLAIFNRQCFAKIHPTTDWKPDEKITMTIRKTQDYTPDAKLVAAIKEKQKDTVEWVGGPMQEVPAKRKRGRPRKIDVVEEMHKQETEEELRGTSHEQKE
jgi:hypothetical protein